MKLIYLLGGGSVMHRSSILTAILVGLWLNLASASAQVIAKPQVMLLSEIISGMPRGEKQKIWVFTATIVPGGKLFSIPTHFPVTLYILQGTFALEMEGHPAVTLKAGQSMVEPPHVKMTGYNRSTTEMEERRLRIADVKNDSRHWLGVNS